MPRKIAPVLVPDGSKYCFTCANVCSLDAFAKDRSKNDGLRHVCRSCDGKRRAETTAIRRHVHRQVSKMEADKSPPLRPAPAPHGPYQVTPRTPAENTVHIGFGRNPYREAFLTREAERLSRQKLEIA